MLAQGRSVTDVPDLIDDRTKEVLQKGKEVCVWESLPDFRRCSMSECSPRGS